MEKATSAPEVGTKIKIYSHEEIVKRIEYLNKQKGIRYQQIAKDAGLKAYYYFMQQISDNFPKQVFQEKSQIKICKYFQTPEIKLMLKCFKS